ncbi:small nuclear ribonucleoprotein [Lactarius deliciosus]|nr:small nuclear ribonucleoprotein [Lactarius deliciosus]
MGRPRRDATQQMMGPEAMGIATVNLVWSDEKVCRNFLCGTCPHTLFTNTSHTERLKTEFLAAREASPGDPIFAKFQTEYENNIFAFRRLEKTPEENAKTTNLMREIAEIELAIQGGTEKIEAFGEQGKVEESMKEMAAIEALKSEKAEKERDLQQLTDTSGASGHQKLRVCDVCGAYLSVLDSDRRLADHFGGKMHLGYHELRNMLTKFREEREKRKTQAAPPPAPSSGGGSTGRGGEHRSSRDDHRDRDRERDRGYSERHSSSRYDDRRRDRSRSPRRRY